MTALVERFEADPASATPLWRIASHKAARVGDRVYLFKQGADPRGVFGVGEIIEPPGFQTDPDDVDEEPTFRAKIRFDRLLDPSRSFLLDFATVERIVPDTLITAMASGNSVPEEVASELEKVLAQQLDAAPPIRGDQADDPSFDPGSVNDQRERALRAIRVRRGQAAFRLTLMEAYGRRCAITGCAVEDVLEAAHITPYLGALTNHPSNGLLLRTDLHTLFDCGLLGIEPRTRTVVIADALRASSYANIADKRIRKPNDESKGPSKRNLEKRFSLFLAIQARKNRDDLLIL